MSRRLEVEPLPHFVIPIGTIYMFLLSQNVNGNALPHLSIFQYHYINYYVCDLQV